MKQNLIVILMFCLVTLSMCQDLNTGSRIRYGSVANGGSLQDSQGDQEWDFLTCFSFYRRVMECDQNIAQVQQFHGECMSVSRQKGEVWGCVDKK